MRRNPFGFRGTRQTKRSLFGYVAHFFQRHPFRGGKSGKAEREGGSLTLISRVCPDRDALDIVLGRGVNAG